jgi:N-methylhydantoinase B
MPGETVISVASGGGGYGSPLERDPLRVKRDMDEGWITPRRATGVYGVVFDGAGRIDQESTLALRRRLASIAPSGRASPD